MALIDCTECRKQISDKAAACPHCGAPLAATAVPRAAVASAPFQVSDEAKGKKKTSTTAWVALLLILIGAFWLLPRVQQEQNLPDMPVEVKTRPALTGPGLVLMVRNTSDRYLTYIVTLKNPTTGQEKSFRLDAAPSGTVEVGHKEGWTLASGDSIKIANSAYKGWGGAVP